MARFLQYFFDGISSGAVYALLALSLVVVFRGTGTLNFAQGEMAMFATFLVWQMYHSWSDPPVAGDDLRHGRRVPHGGGSPR